MEIEELTSSSANMLLLHLYHLSSQCNAWNVIATHF